MKKIDIKSCDDCILKEPYVEDGRFHFKCTHPKTDGMNIDTEVFRKKTHKDCPLKGD